MNQDPVFAKIIDYVMNLTDDSKLVQFLNNMDVGISINDVKESLSTGDFDTENFTLGIDFDLDLGKRIPKQKYLKLKSEGLYLDTYSIFLEFYYAPLSISGVTLEGSDELYAITFRLVDSQVTEDGNPKNECWVILNEN